MLSMSMSLIFFFINSLALFSFCTYDYQTKFFTNYFLPRINILLSLLRKIKVSFTFLISLLLPHSSSNNVPCCISLLLALFFVLYLFLCHSYCQFYSSYCIITNISLLCNSILFFILYVKSFNHSY